MNPTSSRSPRKIRSRTTIRISDWLNEAKGKLVHFPDEPLSSLWALLSFVTGQPNAWLAAHTDLKLTNPQSHQLDGLLDELLSGFPLAYLIQRWSFYNLDFFVNPSVLIPRPETELLVEEALDWLRANPTRRSVAEVGIGSGCISVTLAKRFPDLKIFATDISWSALEVTQINITRHGVDQISLTQTNLLDCMRSKFDLICANLPYIPNKALRFLSVSQYEPILALDGGVDGLNLMRRLFEDIPRWLANGGLLLMEIESGQKDTVMEIAKKVFPNRSIQILDDLAHHPRLLKIETGSISHSPQSIQET